MNILERAIYLSEKYKVDYYYALKILKENDNNLMLAGGYFRDMEKELTHDSVLCFINDKGDKSTPTD